MPRAAPRSGPRTEASPGPEAGGAPGGMRTRDPFPRKEAARPPLGSSPASPAAALAPRRTVVVRPSKAITGLFVIALLFALYLARQLLLPVVLALLFSFLLAPVMRGFRRLRVRPSIAAAIVVVVLMGILISAVGALSEPAAAWLDKAPQVFARLEDKLSPVKRIVGEVSQTAEKVQEFASAEGGRRAVAVQDSTLRTMLFANAQNLLYGAIVGIFMLYFILATRELFLFKLRKVLPSREDKEHAVEIAEAMEVEVSRYLFTAAMIYTGLGAVVALAMWLLGMPNPVLWGVMAGLLNFVPYIGPMVTLTVIAAVAVLTFDDLGRAMLVPAVFLLITSLEGQLITPLIMGRRLELNPLVIFFGIVFWGWLWGVPGALMAVPITVTLKIIFDRIPSLAAVGELLGR